MSTRKDSSISSQGPRTRLPWPSRVRQWCTSRERVTLTTLSSFFPSLGTGSITSTLPSVGTRNHVPVVVGIPASDGVWVVERYSVDGRGRPGKWREQVSPVAEGAQRRGVVIFVSKFDLDLRGLSRTTEQQQVCSVERRDESLSVSSKDVTFGTDCGKTERVAQSRAGPVWAGPEKTSFP